MRIAVVGSRDFKNYVQLETIVALEVDPDTDELVSGGAIGVDSMAQRYAKEAGMTIHIYYPNWGKFGRGAGFIRNKVIVENADLVLAFYRKGHFQEGGAANTAGWARKLGIKLHEYEEK